MRVVLFIDVKVALGFELNRYVALGFELNRYHTCWVLNSNRFESIQTDSKTGRALFGCALIPKQFISV